MSAAQAQGAARGVDAARLPRSAGDHGRTPRPPLTLVALALLAVAATAALTALGTWQLERRVWKLALIDRTERRIHAEPVAAPGPGRWSRINAADYEYRRVMATGQYLNDRETLVRAVTDMGAGFWVLTPFRTTAGFTVLVNRGFVPQERRDPSARTAGQIAGETVVTGLMRLTEAKGGFLHANVPGADRWYSRDVAAIAAARHLSGVAPYFIDADATPNPGGFPVGGLTVVTFRNDHLQYALTWFALALMVAGAGLFVGRDEWRLRRSLERSATQ